MLPAADDVAPWPLRDHLADLAALRRGVAAQCSVSAAHGVKARRILFSLGSPSGDLLAVLDALDRFERAIIECDAPPVIEAHRLECLAVLEQFQKKCERLGSATSA
ncbi:hypothetical protein [Mesorhizobium sp. WSM4313]|uniref:hypothetical protein n=1 Tax=Mesorhizobium sp. WSM4313 TaxID=2029412 RepID=UPI001140A93B|nr:hypothetical protein [Mesorhizobium sp. WSM4313]